MENEDFLPKFKDTFKQIDNDNASANNNNTYNDPFSAYGNNNNSNLKTKI